MVNVVCFIWIWCSRRKFSKASWLLAVSLGQPWKMKMVSLSQQAWKEKEKLYLSIILGPIVIELKMWKTYWPVLSLSADKLVCKWLQNDYARPNLMFLSHKKCRTGSNSYNRYINCDEVCPSCQNNLNNHL